MTFFDQASLVHQAELDRAFAAGEAHGRKLASASVPAELVELRLQRGHDCAAAYRDGVESALLCVFAVGSILAVWGGLAWLAWSW